MRLRQLVSVLGVLSFGLCAALPGPALASGAAKAQAPADSASPLKVGDAAYHDGNYDAAIAAYESALRTNSGSAMAYYRLGQAEVAKGDLKAADAAYESALRQVGTDQALKAKLLFVLADLRERQKSYDDALSAWTTYENFLKQRPPAKTFPETAAERRKRISEYQELVKNYAAVRARIEKRVQDADERARKSAQ